MAIKELIEKLKKIYPRNVDRIDNIIPLVNGVNLYEKEPSDAIEKETLSSYIEALQQICNDLYNEKPSDELIDFQIIINEFRNKYDVTDPREIINIDNGKGYVQ